MKSAGGGIRQYVTVERPIGTNKPAQIDRKLVCSESVLSALKITTERYRKKC